MKIGVIGDESRHLVVEIDDSVNAVVTAEQRTLEGLPEGFSAAGAVDSARSAIRDLQQLVVNTANTIAETVTALAAEPQKVQVEFGIKFAGEGGVPAITKLSSEATIKVSIEWSRKA